MEVFFYKNREKSISCSSWIYLFSAICKLLLYYFVFEKEISPFNLGSGMSYLAKVLILCFLAKPGDVVMIENPEIHLHPRAQSRLGEFFAFLASRGVQLVVETHCKDILNSLHYQLYAEKLKADDVIIYYKASSEKPFQLLSSNDI